MGHQPPSRVPPGVSQVLDRSVDVLSLSPSAGASTADGRGAGGRLLHRKHKGFSTFFFGSKFETYICLL